METMSEENKLGGLEELKLALATHLRDAESLKRPEGIETGLAALDRFLFWHGIPKGALTLFTGALGTGATSLWIEAAAKTLASGKWVVWIDRDAQLSPLPLQHKGMNLGHFVSVEAPDDTDKLFWLLQELMSAQLFDLIGCDLGSLNLKEHQLRKLQAQARDSNAALTLLSQHDFHRRNHEGALVATGASRRRANVNGLFSLIVNFERKRIVIERALHRQTPQSFTRSVTYARFTHCTSDRLGAGSTDLGHLDDQSGDSLDDQRQEPRALPEAPGSSVVGL
jgi:hypothetical protein